MYQSETFHVSQLLLVCLLPLFTLLPSSSCNWLLLLKAALASDPIFKTKCFLISQVCKCLLHKHWNLSGWEGFSWLFVHIVDKPPLMVNWWEMSVRDKLPLAFCYGRAYMFQRDNAKWHAVSIRTARLYNKRRRCIGCLNRFSLPKVQQRVSDVPRHLWTQSCCSFLCNSQTQLCKRHSSNRKLHHTCQNMRQSVPSTDEWLKTFHNHN